MVEWVEANMALAIAGGVAVLLLLLWLLLARRRTRVSLTPRDAGGPAQRNQALIDAAPAAEKVPDAAVPPAASDLGQIKGLGPKLQAHLATLGVTSLAQVAAWDEAEIDRIDAQLGKFAGRVRRDSWVEQARLLANGDAAGFAQKFGNS